MAHPFADAPGPLRSLNVARIATLPKDLARDDILDRRALELVSGLRLRRDIAAHAPELGLDADSPDVLRAFDKLLAGEDGSPGARSLAAELAEGLGHRLGCLLLMLSGGHPANRGKRPEWGDEQWAFWASVRRVVIGGGLFAGAIGDLAVPAAQDVLDTHGAGHLRLSRSPWGSSIVLVGLARWQPDADALAEARREVRGVVDFGQTSIKRGLAQYEAGALAGVRVLSSSPCMCTSLTEAPRDPRLIEQQWNEMLDLMAATVRERWQAGSENGVIEMAASLACYMRGDQPDPMEARSCYGRLQLISPNLRVAARAGLADRLGAPADVRLVDDGTAAALSVTPDEADVVITIGTAMGVGFPLPNHPLAPLTPNFRIE